MKILRRGSSAPSAIGIVSIAIATTCTNLIAINSSSAETASSTTQNSLLNREVLRKSTEVSSTLRHGNCPTRLTEMVPISQTDFGIE